MDRPPGEERHQRCREINIEESWNGMTVMKSICLAAKVRTDEKEEDEMQTT